MLLGITATMPLSASAATDSELTYTDEYGEWTYKLNSNGDGCIITGYDDSMDDIEIPSSINNLPVVEIGGYAFRGYNNITSIIIPDSVTTISDYAFFDSNLTSITISDSVIVIESNAFLSCHSMTSINVSQNNKNYSSIDGVLFNKTQSELIRYPSRKSLNNYTIPDTVETIGDYAFEYAYNLIKIIIPDSVTAIGSGAFLNCWRVTDITLSKSISNIAYSTFYGCNSLTKITIPDGVTTIADRAFYDCRNIIRITIPDGVTAIGNEAFSKCNILVYIIIPDSVTTIGSNAFDSCINLSKVTIPDSVTTIGNYAFNKCYGLKNIIIPNSVTAIGNSAFYLCRNISDVYYTGSESEWNSISIGNYNECLTNANIHFNYGKSVAGDISGDGTLAVDDVIYVLKYVVGNVEELTEEQFAKADLSDDGKLTILDAIMVQRLVLEMV